MRTRHHGRFSGLGAWGALAGGLLLATAAGPAWSASVYIEDSPAALELADEAQRLADAGNAGSAASVLQGISRSYANKLMPTDDGGYTDALLWVRQKIASDPALLRAYRNRFSPEAERALADAVAAGGDEAEVWAVWDRYAWTPAGLDAALRLAGQRIERGDAAGAAAALTPAAEHPDLPERAALYHELNAWAAALDGDMESASAELSALREAGHAAEADSLQLTFAGLPRVGDSVASDTPAADPPPLDRPLWQATIETPETPGTVVAQRAVDRRTGGSRIDLQPVATPRLLLFNDNVRAFALDRMSGRLTWVRHFEETGGEPELGENERQAVAAMNRVRGTGRVARDDRQVLLHRGNGYTVLGYTVPQLGRNRGMQVLATTLNCLDPDTGDVVWSLTPGDLDVGLARASFHGTPVARGGMVIVMARRGQASSFQDSYLFAVDAATGAFRWRRHLASTAGPKNRNQLAALSKMILDGQTVYFCDNLGAAAAVDALTGRVRWVRKLVEDGLNEQGRPFGVATPFSDTAHPTLCAAGLVLPLSVEKARGLLLDPDTGQILQRIASVSPIAEALELRPLPGGDLLAVGAKLARIDGQALTARWTYNPASAEPPRVAVQPDHLLVTAGLNRYEQVDLSNGEVVREHLLPWTGHLLVLDQKTWVVSAGQRVGSYLDWPIAFREMRRRASADPTAVEPGLSMARLALNANQSDAINEGINQAFSALLQLNADRDSEAWQAARSGVFREVLLLTEQRGQNDPAVIEGLFDRLAGITDSPAELVAYNLGRGEFLEDQQRLPEAADFYQAVLMDPRLAGELWTRNQATRRADLVAHQRLLGLVERHGREFYAPFDARAEQELGTLMLDPTTQVADLLALARRYPLAEVAAEATLAAADLQARSETHAGAATQYRRAFQLAVDDDLRRRAAGALAGYYEAQRRPDAAARWLEMVSRDHPALTPLRDGRPVTTDDWLGELRTQEAAAAAPRGVTMPLGKPRRFEGVLMPENPGTGAPASNPDALLMADGYEFKQLIYYRVGETEPRWRVDAPDPNLLLVSLGADNIILWSRTSQRLHGLDPASGEALWPAIPLGSLLADLGEGGLAQTRQANAGQIIELLEADLGPINQQPARRQAGGLAPRLAANDAVVCVVDRQGRAAGIDRYTGQVLWQTALPIDQFSNQIEVGPDVLAVAGLAAPRTEVQAGRVLMLDLVTGRQRFPVVEESEPVRWMGFTPDGDLVVLRRDQASLLDRRNGGTRWRIPLENVNGNVRAVVSGQTLFVHDHARVMSFTLADGQPRADANIPLRNLRVFADDGGLITLLPTNNVPDRCLALDADLNPRWQDAVVLEPKQFFSHALGPRHCFVSAKPEHNTKDQLLIFALERQTGRLAAEVVLEDLEPFPNPGAMRAMNGHLMVSGRGWVILVPGAAAGGE